jgi:hypothetical protein
MTSMTSAGATLSMKVSTSPGAYTEAGFEAITGWLAIGEIVDLGEFGKSYNLVQHNPIGNRKTIKKKGAYNEGQLVLQVARDPADTGQAGLITALASDLDSSFKIVMQDTTTLYFVAQVLSYTTNLGSVDQIVGATITVEITNDIIQAVTP